MPLVIPIFVRGGEGEQGSLNFRGGVACEQADLFACLICVVVVGDFMEQN